MDRGKIAILACKSGKPFAEQIIKFLSLLEPKEISLIKSKEKQFSNKEIKTEIDESIRGSDVYIVQDVANSTTGLSVDENIRALTTVIDAAHRADAKYVTAILPVFPYARQEKSISREGITAARVAQEIEDSGADRIITLDIHAEAIAGFFRKAKFENLKASRNIIPFIEKNIKTDNLIVSSADTGGAPRANYYANKLKVPRAIVFKIKDYDKPAGQQVIGLEVNGNVNGKKVCVVDDMIDTASTAEPVIKTLRNKGATQVYFVCSLPLFNTPAIERLTKLYEEKLLDGVFGTNAVYHGGEEFLKKYSWYKEVNVADYFARVIYNINKGISISKLL